MARLNNSAANRRSATLGNGRGSSDSESSDDGTASGGANGVNGASGAGGHLDLTQNMAVDKAGYDVDLGGEQSVEERRRIQRQIRELIKQTTTQQPQFLDAKAEVLHSVLEESESLLREAKQTTEAAVDAALVIRVSELAYKRTAHFLADRSDDTGVNLEDFVSRCQDYMRFGRGIADENSRDLSRAQRRRRRVEAAAHRRGDEEEEGVGSQDDNAAANDDAISDEETGDEDEAAEEAASGGRRRAGRAGGGGGGEKLDWAHFGQYACLPRIRRAGLARFLPRAGLAADEKTRVQRKRTAALRLNDLQEVRPQVLRPGDLSVSQNSDLTALATDILQQLRRVAEHGQDSVQRAYEELDEGADADGTALLRLMDRYGIRSDGGVDLIRFAVNPHSFAQTVENFFYISFLVRDGRVGLAYDDNGLPSIYPISDEESELAKENNAREEDTRKHQLILSIDMALWRDMIQTFKIKRSMIAHRETAGEAHPGGRAWFS